MRSEWAWSGRLAVLTERAGGSINESEASTRAGPTSSLQPAQGRPTRGALPIGTESGSHPAQKRQAEPIGLSQDGHDFWAALLLDDLLAQAPRIRGIATAHGATNLAVFGPVARDQAGPDSDLDLLVDLPPRTGLLERISLKQALEDTLHCLVDLIRRRNL